jgi:hypothetical protein
VNENQITLNKQSLDNFSVGSTCSKNVGITTLPVEVICLIFSQLGDESSKVKFLQTSKSYYYNQSLCKEFCLDVLDFYPGLKKIKNEEINWNQVASDKRNNVNHITSKNQYTMQFVYNNIYTRIVWQNAYPSFATFRGVGFSLIPKPIKIDSNKIITEKIKESIQKDFKEQVKNLSFHTPPKYTDWLLIEGMVADPYDPNTPSSCIKGTVQNPKDRLFHVIERMDKLWFVVASIRFNKLSDNDIERNLPVPDEWLNENSVKNELIEDETKHSSCNCTIF